MLPVAESSRTRTRASPRIPRSRRWTTDNNSITNYSCVLRLYRNGGLWAGISISSNVTTLLPASLTECPRPAKVRVPRNLMRSVLSEPYWQRQVQKPQQMLLRHSDRDTLKPSMTRRPRRPHIDDDAMSPTMNDKAPFPATVHRIPFTMPSRSQPTNLFQTIDLMSVDKRLLCFALNPALENVSISDTLTVNNVTTMPSRNDADPLVIVYLAS